MPVLNEHAPRSCAAGRLERPHGRGPRVQTSDSLSDAQKVALRLHDAFLFHPGRVSAALRAEALAHFSAPQLVELALKFYFWSSNRPTVALGKLSGDAPHDRDRLTSFHYDDEGRYIVHSNP